MGPTPLTTRHGLYGPGPLLLVLLCVIAVNGIEIDIRSDHKASWIKFNNRISAPTHRRHLNPTISYSNHATSPGTTSVTTPATTHCRRLPSLLHNNRKRISGILDRLQLPPVASLLGQVIPYTKHHSKIFSTHPRAGRAFTHTFACITNIFTTVATVGISTPENSNTSQSTSNSLTTITGIISNNPNPESLNLGANSNLTSDNSNPTSVSPMQTNQIQTHTQTGTQDQIQAQTQTWNHTHIQTHSTHRYRNLGNALCTLSIAFAIFMDIFFYSFPLPLMPTHLNSQGLDSSLAARLASASGVSSLVAGVLIVLVQNRPRRRQNTRGVSERNQFRIMALGSLVYLVGSVSIIVNPSFHVLLFSKIIMGLISQVCWVFALALTSIHSAPFLGMQPTAWLLLGNSMGELAGPLFGTLTYDLNGLGLIPPYTISSVLMLFSFVSLAVSANFAPYAITNNRSKHAQSTHHMEHTEPLMRSSTLKATPSKTTQSQSPATSTSAKLPSPTSTKQSEPESASTPSPQTPSSPLSSSLPPSLSSPPPPPPPASPPPAPSQPSQTDAALHSDHPTSRSISKTNSTSKSTSNSTSTSDPILVWNAWTGAIITGVVRGVVDVLLPVYLATRFELNEKGIGLLFGLATVTYAIGTSIAGRLKTISLKLETSVANIIAVLSALVFVGGEISVSTIALLFCALTGFSGFFGVSVTSAIQKRGALTGRPEDASGFMGLLWTAAFALGG
ncbi:hypothetical protein AAMO2058_000167400 [Amorphochlora amoebiformis]